LHVNIDPVLLTSRMQPMKAHGLWRDETINLYFQRALEQCPDKPAIVSNRAGRDEPIRLSYPELDTQVERIARGLIALGVDRSKDVVIRGGKNIPAVEIESLLYKHPAISPVAAVGYPDRRFGESASR
jgi:non-ribosomal peptide synthetase component E (peptide arylation enzyme)